MNGLFVISILEARQIFLPLDDDFFKMPEFSKSKQHHLFDLVLNVFK